jgi:PIN domain nuclease of toxin-antitoxin system
MKLLLDTHALLWWWTDDPKLSKKARELIADEANTILISAASAWEIATTYRLGKLGLAAEAVPRFNELIVADGFEHLAVTYLHALKAAAYAEEHRDPFDRMLAAQSALESVPLVTCDRALDAFDVRTIW